jgi:hypothetical protein
MENSACPHTARQLLVAQQVTASVSDIPVVEHAKAETSFGIHYICRLRPADSDTGRT